MNFQEAVDRLTEGLESALQEDHVQDAVQDIVEDILVDYYGWDLEAWANAESAEKQIEEEESEIALEDFLWADIGVAALLKIAGEWARGRPELKRLIIELPEHQRLRIIHGRAGE